ncbi:hypothetical protein ACFL6Y_08325 [Elusimicrobiota bacterium]
MIELSVRCIHCNHSLMDKSHKIDSLPSIKLKAVYGKKKGNLYLSRLYGSYKIQMDLAISQGRIARFFCPHCKQELIGNRVCDRCEAQMAPLALKKGGQVQICTRKGCTKHLIEFEDPEAEIRAFYDSYSTFFK